MNRLSGIVAMASLSTVLLNQATTPVTCTPQKQPDHTGAYVAVGIGAAAVLGTVVLVEMHKDHHRIKGCVSMGPNGLELQDQNDTKTYALSGVTANVKVGDVIKLHGTKEKVIKGSTGERTFAVEKMSRDYGPCKLLPKVTASVDSSSVTPQS